MIKETYWKIDKAGDKEKVIAGATADALIEFCKQEPEFEQAIEQSGKTFKQCLKHCVEGCGNAISDFTVFSRAVEFYFKGAKIHFNMTVDLTGQEKKEDPTLTFSLDDLI